MQEWTRLFSIALAKHYDLAPQSLQSLGPVSSSEIDTTPTASRLQIKWVPASSAPKPGDKKGTADGDWRSVKVLCNKELHSPISDRSARHIELDVKVYSTRHSSHDRTRTRATAHALVWSGLTIAVPLSSRVWTAVTSSSTSAGTTSR